MHGTVFVAIAALDVRVPPAAPEDAVPAPPTKAVIDCFVVDCVIWLSEALPLVAVDDALRVPEIIARLDIVLCPVEVRYVNSDPVKADVGNTDTVDSVPVTET